MPHHRLPDFVIIGATKAATTWLSHNLGAHPEVFLPSQELHYFSRFYDRGKDWYGAHFGGARSKQRIGEKSASYLPHPDAAQRLCQLLPRARLIAQLRNPVERAYSDYCMHYRRGEVSRDIDRYLDPARTPIPRLLEDGFYHRHLTGFLSVFPAEQMMVLLYDDIRRRPAEIFRGVCGYLGIDEAVAPQAVERRVKDKDIPVVPPSARRLLAPLKELMQPWRETRAFGAIRSLIARRLRYPPLTPELRERLTAHYAADVARLSELIGRDLSMWKAESAGSPRAADPARVGHCTWKPPAIQATEPSGTRPAA
jgi:Sulfotransferase domain